MKLGEPARRDPAEQRAAPGTEPLEGKMAETPSSAEHLNETRTDSETGEGKSGLALKTLAHHIDVDWLREAYRRTRKDGARASTDRARSSTRSSWRTTSSRFSIARSPGRTGRRRCGGCTSRRAMGRRRGPSAFRPSRTRSCSARWRWCWGRLRAGVSRLLVWLSARSLRAPSAASAPNAAVRWPAAGSSRSISEEFFDTLDHAHLREILRRRIGDGVLLRLIGKWLNAGVLEGASSRTPKRERRKEA